MFTSRPTLAAIVTLLLISSFPTSVMAHCHDDEGENLIRDLISRERWDDDDSDIEYHVNNSSHPNHPSFFPDVTVAHARWNDIPRPDAPEENVNFDLSYAGATTKEAGRKDKQNVVSWVSMRNNDIVARVYTFYHRRSINRKWIIEQDTGFNYYLDWAPHLNNDDDKYCIRQVAVHEFGHWVKLKDLTDIVDRYRYLTMYGVVIPGLHSREYPQCEDKWGVWFTYHVMQWNPRRAPSASLDDQEPDGQEDVARTRLLNNYPDPFNPETWIPYELASDSNVSVDIYDSGGGLVRIDLKVVILTGLRLSIGTVRMIMEWMWLLVCISIHLEPMTSHKLSALLS